ncbi:hypothetical protein [Streptomyces luteogriseus]|uniref:hypothetical protein n=1 Tax=Streptomyces luteogriseus TaxID=68233 RepID=UPI0037F2C81F
MTDQPSHRHPVAVTRQPIDAYERFRCHHLLRCCHRPALLIARLFDMVFTRAMEAAVKDFISAHGIELETEQPAWRPYRHT